MASYLLPVHTVLYVIWRSYSISTRFTFSCIAGLGTVLDCMYCSIYFLLLAPPPGVANGSGRWREYRMIDPGKNWPPNFYHFPAKTARSYGLCSSWVKRVYRGQTWYPQPDAVHFNTAPLSTYEFLVSSIRYWEGKISRRDVKYPISIDRHLGVNENKQKLKRTDSTLTACVLEKINLFIDDF